MLFVIYTGILQSWKINNEQRWGTEWIPSGSTQDDKEYRINSYRVLLTRGRDGFIVFIPPVADMDIIEKVFKDAGVRKLEEKLEW